MAKKLKIAFAGTPEFAIPSLRSLIADEGIEVVAVFTQPDQSAGRGNRLTPPPIKIFAEENGIPVFQKKIDASKIQKLNLDFLAVVAFGMILPSEVLEVPRFGCVNLHASLLPKFRGASPIQSAILSGEAKTGVSFMRISEQLDAGDIFAQFEIEIGKKNAEQLSVELAKLGDKFPEVLKKIARGKLKATPQNSAEATSCSKIRKADGRVSWEEDSAEIILRKLRAFAGWPSVFTSFQGKILKLIELESWQLPVGSRQNGEVFAEDGKIGVKVVDGAIELKKVQLAGKKVLPAAEFARGERGFVGAKLR
ncbi:methionyl-tRNA formyltransferase [Patescibacteria group bacterium]|nr:methionyl-tRNA formyltransferase [Patescibacteria group bacterium]